MSTKLDFLAQLPIFKALNQSELIALAQISEAYEFDQGVILAYQRDVANELFILRRGRLLARSVETLGPVHEEMHAHFLPGDYFDARWLFAEYAHPATIKGATAGQIITIQGPKFLQFLEQHRSVLDKLAPIYDTHGNFISGLPEAAWAEAKKVRLKASRQSTAVSLLPDELVEFSSRRSRWFLFLRAIGPTLSLLIFPVAAYLLLAGITSEGLGRLATIIIPALLALVSVVFLAFQALDWANDYFVITSKRLVHREFNLRTFRINIKKVPIEQVQSVEVVKPNFIANLFNIGTARITTAAAAGTLYFDNIDNPIAVKETLNRLSQRVKSLDAGREQASMRQTIEKYFHIQPLHKVQEPPTAVGADTAAGPSRKKEGFWTRLRKRYIWRLEEGNVITYRKHFFVLFQEIAWPISIMGALVLINLILITLFEFTFAQLLLVFPLLYLINLGWLIWQLEDWRNDTFQVTDRFVIDIDRKPFGFGESRKQADLRNVQNVNADRPGILATIFNFGDVIIETAGATADITFENVPKPSVIQSDIFRWRDLDRQKQRVREGENRRKEYAVLLDVYKQAEEQGQIPRRTPDFDQMMAAATAEETAEDDPNTK